MSIRVKYEKDLKEVFNKLIDMCRNIEEMLDGSVTALVNLDKKLAEKVIEHDEIIDNFERTIEQDCLKMLLMEHPVARDFRDVSAALKMITDLERIGDQCRDIAELTLQIKENFHVRKLIHIPKMGEIVTEMVKAGVQSYINRDLELARSLDKTDDKVDALFENVKSDLIAAIKKDSSEADRAIILMMIAKYLERIGDHAVNIGEWVEYAITGEYTFHPEGRFARRDK